MSENPQAFPFQGSNAADAMMPEFGMTLRDWFAGQALAGWLATYSDDAEHPAAEEASPGWAPSIAAASYRMADAMIAERAKVQS